jgi:CDP-paratose 2-epimerase
MVSGKSRNVLITGGAGFIGSNLAERLLRRSRAHVRIFDNLSRLGVEHNLEWLQSIAGPGRLEVVRGDVRDEMRLQDAARDVSEIYHLAAQVAVTNSVEDPRNDFAVNACGTFNVLEAARRSGLRPFVLFTSTNKVYGALESLQVTADGTHYRAENRSFRGVNEREPLDFHSPYGCSKGAADQYVRDYARIYDLPTVVFRMSCIAGPRQFGNEDQGWVAHFFYSALDHMPITVFGDGLQVRDVLHVDDLLDAMMAARAAGGSSHGQVYNVGGGMERTVSVLEMLSMIEQRTGERINIRSREVRPGDQPLYISDTFKLSSQTQWRPQRSLADTLEALHDFWRTHRTHIGKVRQPVDLVPELAGEVA